MKFEKMLVYKLNYCNFRKSINYIHVSIPTIINIEFALPYPSYLHKIAGRPIHNFSTHICFYGLNFILNNCIIIIVDQKKQMKIIPQVF